MSSVISLQEEGRLDTDFGMRKIHTEEASLGVSSGETTLLANQGLIQGSGIVMQEPSRTLMTESLENELLDIKDSGFLPKAARRSAKRN